MTQTQTIEVEPDGIQATLEDIFKDVQDQFKDIDYTPVLQGYMTELETAHVDYFMEEHDPVGKAWKPLSPRTIARKGHDQILFETGALMNSPGGQTADSIKLVFREGDGTYLVFGTGVEYAHWHMTGTTRMPARPFLGLNDELLETLTTATADAAVDALMKGNT